MNLKAIHQIIRGNTGSREVLNPGAVFVAVNEEAQYLLRVGAAVRTDEAPAKTAPTPVIPLNTGGGEGGENTGEGSGSTEDDTVEEVELADMTVAALRELAEMRGIDLGSASKKGDIIAAIEAAEEDII